MHQVTLQWSPISTFKTQLLYGTVAACTSIIWGVSCSCSVFCIPKHATVPVISLYLQNRLFQLNVYINTLFVYMSTNIGRPIGSPECVQE